MLKLVGNKVLKSGVKINGKPLTVCEFSDNLVHSEVINNFIKLKYGEDIFTLIEKTLKHTGIEDVCSSLHILDRLHTKYSRELFNLNKEENEKCDRRETEVVEEYEQIEAEEDVKPQEELKWESDSDKNSALAIRLRGELEDKINVGCGELSTQAFRFFAKRDSDDIVLKVVDSITYNSDGDKPDYGRKYSDSCHYGTKAEANELLRVYYENKKKLDLIGSEYGFEVPLKDFYFETTREGGQALIVEGMEHATWCAKSLQVTNFIKAYYWEANKSWLDVKRKGNK
jgi:hypothetical protein